MNIGLISEMYFEKKYSQKYILENKLSFPEWFLKDNYSKNLVFKLIG